MDKNHQHNNLNHPFGGDGCTAGGGGYTDCCSGGANEALGNIYRNDVSFVGLGKFQRPKSSVNRSTTYLQPFDNFPFACPFKSPGGEMPSSFGIPFTSAQWKELQRQVLIYKYMISSVTIPPDLLFPLSTANLDSFSPSIYNVRYSKNGDLEPGRCKRTDGKKWRCSKDATPLQRYCEHHLRRGHSARSRKLVEVKNNGGKNYKKTRLQQIPEPPLFSFKAKTDLTTTDTPSRKGTDRDLFALNSAEQQWKSLAETKMGFGNEGPSVYTPDLNIRDCVDVFSYPKLPAPEIEYSTGFFNAWSNHGNLSPSSLNLSMAIAAGDVLDQEIGNIQMESEIEDSVDHSRVLLDDPVSFDPFGPLGEVLHPGSVPDSPYYDSVMSSNPATNVSSPSGVLQRTLFLHSDESVCNSPTLAAIPSEVTFNWFS